MDPDPRILVVDHTPDLARNVEAALGPVGYDVDWSADLEGAIGLLEARGHDLAIVEADLGVLEGGDVIVALRSRHHTLRAILTSVDHSEATLAQARVAGAFFAPKALGPRAIRLLVDACLRA